ncbi:hypothetical protein SynPROSU1_02185 [Synechococcus sp. PROS-U-1]|nr:hypothetical protein SynPROSU1_02185 [Synechococcus sp. PROS-U-1]
MHQASRHRIVRSDGTEDNLTRQHFDSYDAAYDELERYYVDFCCSDDDRVEYTIVCEGSDSLDSTGIRRPGNDPDLESTAQGSTSPSQGSLQENSLKSQSTETHP